MGNEQRLRRLYLMTGFQRILESHGIQERNFPGLESHGK